MNCQLTGTSPDCAILIYWRLSRPGAQTLLCISFRTSAGLELRAGAEGEAPVAQAHVATHAEAQRLADVWRAQFMRSVAA